MRLKFFIITFLVFGLTVAHANPKMVAAGPATSSQDVQGPSNAPIEKQTEAPSSSENGQKISPLPELPSSHEMTNSYESALVRMLVTLLGLVFLVFATFWILRRLGKGKFKMGSSGRMVNVIERRALSPKTMLYVVEIGNKKVLISESQLEVRTLANYEELPETNE
jgi:flagellar protein FliO/FliZ